MTGSPREAPLAPPGYKVYHYTTGVSANIPLIVLGNSIEKRTTPWRKCLISDGEIYSGAELAS